MRLGKAGKLLRPEVFQIKQLADLPAGRFGDHQRVRRGQGLQPSGKVRRLADDPALLRCALADQIADHGQPGGDAEPHTQVFARRQPADRFDHRESGVHRPLGIVLMRLRISEIDQHAVAHIFGDKAVKAADRLGDSAVVVPDQLAQILGVMTGRERGRADKVAEHHRQLSAFGIDLCRCTRRARRHHGGRNCHAEAGNRVEQLAPVADRGHPDADQVFGG